MLLVDTHAHLNFPDYEKDRDEIVRRSLDGGVWMINVGCDKETSIRAVDLTQKYSEGIFAAVGLHPNNISEEKFDPETYRQLAGNSPRVVAIGETGLDYYRIPQNRDTEEVKQSQKKTFLSHLGLAEELEKPIIFHVRNAHDDVLEILKGWLKIRKIFGGVVHSFSGDAEQAEVYRELGFKIAFNGIITFSQDYDGVILDTPLEDILLETDCPFLAPVPYRGKRNEPGYIIEVAEQLAGIKKLSLEEVVKRTTNNAGDVFGIHG